MAAARAAGEVELPGPRPRNTCCCRRRRGHTQAQRRPLPGHWLAPGSLTSASGRCRVSAANTHTHTRARARAHGRAPGYTRAGTRPSRPHQPGESRTLAGRGSATLRLPGGPWLDRSGVPDTLVSEARHLIAQVGDGQFQHDRHASRALAGLVTTASPVPTTVSGTEQAQ